MKNSFFYFDFAFPENAISGDYAAEIKVYDELTGKKANQGYEKININIKQISKKIKIIAGNNIVPGGNLSFTANLLDQADEKITNKSVKIKIYNSKDKLINETSTESRKENLLKLGINSANGYWKIIAEYEDIEEKKLFYVQEFEKADFTIEQDAITITNTGNIQYKKPITIKIGNKEEIRNIILDVGESIKLKLNAPDGNYNISVSDKNIEKQTSSFLTGNAIGISELSRTKNNTTRILMVAVIFILIVIFIIFKKLFKHRISDKNKRH